MERGARDCLPKLPMAIVFMMHLHSCYNIMHKINIIIVHALRFAG